MLIIKIIQILILLMGIICLFRPKIIIYLFATITIIPTIPTVPVDIDLKILQIGSINIYIYDYLIALSLLSILKFIIGGKKKEKKCLTDLMKIRSVRIALIYLIWNILIMGILSYSKGFEFQNICRRYSYELIIILCVFVPQIIENEGSKEKFFKFCVFISVLLGVFVFIRYLTHEVVITSSGTLRAINAKPLTVTYFSICYLLFGSKMKNEHLTVMVGIVTFLSISILLSGHRSAFLVLFCILSIYFVSESFSRIEHLWVPFIGIACVLILIFWVQTNNLSRNENNLIAGTIERTKDIFNLKNETTQDRLVRWKNAINIVIEKPIIGLGRYPVYTSLMNENKSSMAKFSEIDRAEHNIFVEIVVHQGLVGLFILIMFFYFIFKESGKQILKPTRYLSFLRKYLLMFILYSMFTTVFSDTIGRIYFFIALGFLFKEIVQDNYVVKNKVVLKLENYETGRLNDGQQIG